LPAYNSLSPGGRELERGGNAKGAAILENKILKNDKGQGSNIKSSPKSKLQNEVVLAFKYLDFKRLFQNSPLKIRGARGVMKIMKITPFIPPYFKGDSGGKK
jgi:hypothetical protein